MGNPLEYRPATHDALLFRFVESCSNASFVGTVISETVASNRGIGNLMMIASSSFDVPLVFAGLFILAALGVALYAGFSLVEGRVTGWAVRSESFAAGG
jgi:NitT/TauT family transport system permease protein